MRIGNRDELPDAERGARGRRQREVISSKTVMQAIGDWLFTGNRVYRLVEPNRVLTVKKIRWNRETSDLEGEDGRVFRDVSWDDMEFADEVEYHLPDEPN